MVDVEPGPRCDVWWMVPGPVSVDDLAVLPEDERWRFEQLRRVQDRERFLAAASLLRRLVAVATGIAPERVRVDRTCRTCARPHGRPTLPGTGLQASISHSGRRVAVALTRRGPVGVDVERVSERLDLESLGEQVLGQGEQAVDTDAFLRYWTRKEAVVKATGDGIGVDLRRVLVTAADQQPGLLAYPHQPELPATLADLDPGEGYFGAVCVLAAGPVPVTERWYPTPLA